MKYLIAEKFKSIQGEGVYAGTPMAFIRFVGCSVGKKICQHCDTIFERTLPWQGGGEFTPMELAEWAYPYQHVCFTGGEPLDQDLEPLVHALEVFFDMQTGAPSVAMVHVETSGTHTFSNQEYLLRPEIRKRLWVCVSPKPGFIEQVVHFADEVKVIVPGLGTPESLQRMLFRDGSEHPNTVVQNANYHEYANRDTFRWPTPEDALRWAAAGKIVFLQPRNERYDIDRTNLMYCQDFIAQHPELRLSVQLHKILKVQ